MRMVHFIISKPISSSDLYHQPVCWDTISSIRQMNSNEISISCIMGCFAHMRCLRGIVDFSQNVQGTLSLETISLRSF